MNIWWWYNRLAVSAYFDQHPPTPSPSLYRDRFQRGYTPICGIVLTGSAVSHDGEWQVLYFKADFFLCYNTFRSIVLPMPKFKVVRHSLCPCVCVFFSVRAFESKCKRKSGRKGGEGEQRGSEKRERERESRGGGEGKGKCFAEIHLSDYRKSVILT